MSGKVPQQQVRTQGDGIENTETTKIEKTFKSTPKPSSVEANSNINKLGKEYLSKQTTSTSTILYDPTTDQRQLSVNYPPPVVPKGKRFYLIPKLVKQSQDASRLGLKNRKLNLVLMEPYRACVSPIFPYKRDENRVKIPPSKNNLDLNDLVRHINMNMQEATASKKDDSPLAEIKRERDSYEAQLRFQTQVNTELKGLLVHCLGEDLQSTFNNLTEDKMKIAKSLSTNTEQIEFLSSQSEVWRSKFLASSLMVEELARVKTSLAQRNALLVASNKQLLAAFERIRFDLIETFQNLKFLSGVSENNLKSLCVTDLTAECLNISQQVVLNSGKIGLPSSSNFDGFETHTEAEKCALRALTESKDLINKSDDAFRAVCIQAQQEYKREKTQSEHDLEVVEK